MGQPGIALRKPTTGRFVQLDDGRFMVPYATTIPGTDVEFWMIPIPGGKFHMGSEDKEHPDEGPVFEVTVEPFWMAKHEITWAEFERFMTMNGFFKELQASGIRTINDRTIIDAVSAPSNLYTPDLTYDAGELPNQPAATITQFSAKQYTKWLSLSTNQFFRLPFETEWEYACRAGTTTKFYFGDDVELLPKHAWFDDNSDYQRHQVGQLTPNPWGLYDMLGNVSEWTLDQYDTKGYTQVAGRDLSKPLTTNEAFNKPTTLYPRTLRGGSWELLADDCRCSSRLGSSEEWKADDVNYPRSPWWFTSEIGTGAGFRIIRPLNAPHKENREHFWKADLKKIARAVENRVERNGRGATAPVDANLHRDIESLKKNK